MSLPTQRESLFLVPDYLKCAMYHRIVVGYSACKLSPAACVACQVKYVSEKQVFMSVKNTL